MCTCLLVWTDLNFSIETFRRLNVICTALSSDKSESGGLLLDYSIGMSQEEVAGMQVDSQNAWW